jgi:hypothetical protein
LGFFDCTNSDYPLLELGQATPQTQRQGTMTTAYTIPIGWGIYLEIDFKYAKLDIVSRSHLAITMSEISVGGKVRLIAIPPYLKTANPMPMLRPSELLSIDDIGTVLDRR